MATGDDRTELELLRDIARWTREAALPNIQKRAERLLDSDAKKRVYGALAEGIVPVATVEASTGVNHNDIRSWAKTWEVEGIIDKESNPPKALFTLRELGIETPPPKATRTAKTKP